MEGQVKSLKYKVKYNHCNVNSRKITTEGQVKLNV